MARIGIDLDGVCYDFAVSLRQYLHERRGAGVYGSAKSCSGCKISFPDPKRWEFYLDWGLSEDEFKSAVREGVKARIVFGHGRALPGAKEALEALKEAGHTLVIVTDRTGLGGDEAVHVSTKWLEREELPFDELHFDSDKTNYNCDYFIDDKLENYDALDEAGVRVWLYDRPWNQDTSIEGEGIARNRVRSWPEFVDRVADAEGWRCTREQGALSNDEVRIVSETGGAKGQKNARLGSIDPRALLTMAEVAGFGEQKYARLNYLNGYDWSLSWDACQRHLLAFWSGQDNDEESGLPHLAHAAWHCLAMLAFMQHGLGTDDRFVV